MCLQPCNCILCDADFTQVIGVSNITPTSLSPNRPTPLSIANLNETQATSELPDFQDITPANTSYQAQVTSNVNPPV